MATHETDDVVELIVAKRVTKDVAKLFFPGGGNLKSKFLFQNSLGFACYHVLQSGAKHIADRTVKLAGLCRTHPQDLDADNGQPRAGKEVNDVARLASGETKIV